MGNMIKESGKYLRNHLDKLSSTQVFGFKLVDGGLHVFSTVSGRLFLHWYIINNVNLWMLTQKKMELDMEEKNVVIVVIVHSMTE